MDRHEPGSAIAAQPEGIFPAPGLPVAPPLAWPTRRDAVRAAATVACVVGLPAVVAAGAVLLLFALSAAVLVAPLVAAALTWAAWHVSRAPARSAKDAPEGSQGSVSPR